MSGQPTADRIAVYECHVSGQAIWKGKWISGYYGLFDLDRLKTEIIPHLKRRKEAGLRFDYPLLVVSYSLGQGDPPKPLPMSVAPKKLNIKAAGGLIAVRRMMGIPIRRKKRANSECWEALIYEAGKVTILQARGKSVSTCAGLPRRD